MRNISKQIFLKYSGFSHFNSGPKCKTGGAKNMNVLEIGKFERPSLTRRTNGQDREIPM